MTFQRRRARAGMQQPIATILLVIAAIALVGIAWLYASSTAQTMARTAKIEIIEAKYLLGASNTAIVTVKNTGNIPVSITSISIPGVTCTFNIGTAGTAVQPGSTASFTATGCQALTPGTKITIIVQGTAQGTNEPVSALAQAVVM